MTKWTSPRRSPSVTRCWRWFSRHCEESATKQSSCAAGLLRYARNTGSVENDELFHCAGARRRGAEPQPRRLGGAARPAAEPRPPAEGRPPPDLDPGAGRAISDLSRAGQGAPAGDCRRLSRDGGLAGLSQKLPAAAQGPDGRSVAGGAGAAAAAAAAAARRDARGRRPADGPRPDRPRRLRPRRAGRAEAGAQVGTGRPAPFDLYAAYGRVKARTQPAMHVVAHRAGDDAGGCDPARCRR